MTTELQDRQVIYRGVKVSACGGQPVVKVENGIIESLSPERSLDVVNHSPDGFQWGYSGSGPSQTALALLLDATNDPDIAWKYHEDFKRDHVAAWGDRWEITRRDILLWLEMTEKSYYHGWLKRGE